MRGTMLRKVLLPVLLIIALTATNHEAIASSDHHRTIVLGPNAAAQFPDGFSTVGVAGDETLLFAVQPAATSSRPNGVHVVRRRNGQLLGDLVPPANGWQVPLVIKIIEYGSSDSAWTEGIVLVLDAGARPTEAGTKPGIIYRYQYAYSHNTGLTSSVVSSHVLPLFSPSADPLPNGLFYPISMGLLPNGGIAVIDTFLGAIWVASSSLADWHLAIIDPRFQFGFGEELQGIGRAPGGGTQPYRLLLPTPPGAPGPVFPGIHSITYAAITDEVYTVRTASPGGIFGIPLNVLLDETKLPFEKGGSVRTVVAPTPGVSDQTVGLDYDRFHPTTPWLYWHRAPSDEVGGGFNTLRRINLLTGEIEVLASSNTLYDWTEEISVLPGIGNSPYTYIVHAMGQLYNNPDANMLLGGIPAYVGPELISITAVSND